ncbi:hypothetical protein L915_02210 [Phytophthora nicotianae]|uniref:Uncharacterized protein n=1 Tax=Phytophthora nicotianae TaxID=4792 RepID=W2HHP8_PHYNI|nr:hypothetical protein L915_02210 [Phytophthora nicotianae]ETL48192.1 hypothetical protein L916_02171 [Phytophthora nicotianae]
MQNKTKNGVANNSVIFQIKDQSVQTKGLLGSLPFITRKSSVIVFYGAAEGMLTITSLTHCVKEQRFQAMHLFALFM